MVSNIISSVMALFGITSAPATVSDFLWDCIVLFVGLYIIKYVMIFVTGLFREMMRLN